MASSYIINNKVANVGAIAEFSQGARTFVPAFNTCPVANTQDNFGRYSGPGALNTLTAPGCYSAQPIILNENSLRPVLASNPLYKNVQAGLGGNGADTLFGMGLPGRGRPYSQMVNIAASNAAEKCLIPKELQGKFDYPGYANVGKDLPCFNPDYYSSYVGSRNSDIINSNATMYGTKTNNFMTY